LAERRLRAEQVGERAAQSLCNAILSGACVDEYLQDQIVVYMALAQGVSKVRVGEISQHTETAMHFAEKMTGCKFRVEELDDSKDGPSGLILECKGIGYISRGSREGDDGNGGDGSGGGGRGETKAANSSVSGSGSTARCNEGTESIVASCLDSKEVGNLSEEVKEEETRTQAPLEMFGNSSPSLTPTSDPCNVEVSGNGADEPSAALGNVQSGLESLPQRDARRRRRRR